MQKNNKKCITCGKEYRYCPTCKGRDYSEAWRNIYCSKNCQEIFNVVTGYVNNKLSVEQAQERISKCDLSYKEKMKPNLVSRIDEIMSAQTSKAEDYHIDIIETKDDVAVQDVNTEPIASTTEDTTSETVAAFAYTPEGDETSMEAETMQSPLPSEVPAQSIVNDYKNYYNKKKKKGKPYKQHA